MGLRQDGVENVSSAMDRDYNESSRSRSRDHSRKSSDAKNHRPSREGGLNGSHPVPLEKPLSVIINRTDNFENGHYSTAKSGFNHLLADEFTKNALNAVHGFSSTPGSSAFNSGPSTSSSTANPSFVSPPKLAGRTEEVQKRRHIVEKIERMREGNKLESFIPQMEVSTPTQMSTNVRRYAKKAPEKNLPDNIRNFILEGTDPPVTSNKSKSDGSSSKNARNLEDGEETDYEDLDRMEEMGASSSSSALNPQWIADRAEFLVMDTKYEEAIENTQHQILVLVQQLEGMEAGDQDDLNKWIASGDGEDGCARLIPYDKSKRRKLIKMNDQILDTIPSTSRETASLCPPTFTRQAQQYLHRTSIMASFHIRKNRNKSIWMNTRELEEEKIRNGVRKKEEKEKREKRKAVKEEKDEEESDEYEATDDEEEELPTPNHSRKTNGAPKEKKRRKDTERKTSRINKGGGIRRSSDCPPMSRLSSVTSRPSLDGDTMDFLTPSFNHQTWLESFKAAMPTNFTYNKIPVPECQRVEIEAVPSANNEEAEPFNTDNMMRRMAQQHHTLEHDERIRFQIHPRNSRATRREQIEASSRDEREESQDSGRSRSTPSGGPLEETGETTTHPPPIPPPVSTPAPSRGRGAAPIRPPPPQFDYDSIRPIVDYERLSAEAPYDKRKFSQ